MPLAKRLRKSTSRRALNLDKKKSVFGQQFRSGSTVMNHDVLRVPRRKMKRSRSHPTFVKKNHVCPNIAIRRDEKKKVFVNHEYNDDEFIIRQEESVPDKELS